MSVAEALRAAAARLAATSDTARLDAELLMAHALGVTRSGLLLGHMPDEVPAAFAELVERRAAHEPVAYIAGRQEFFGLELRVTPDVLIPRSDSETIVEAALERMGEEGRVLDLGTGSGALLLAFLANRPGWGGVGIERSEPALAVAQANAAGLGLQDRAELWAGDWTQPGWADHLGRFDLILCNPPYVEDHAELDPDVRSFEPAEALFSGVEGLDDYRILIPRLDGLLAEGGIAILEIGHKQGDAVAEIAANSGFNWEIRHDLGDRPRAAILERGLGKARSNL